MCTNLIVTIVVIATIVAVVVNYGVNVISKALGKRVYTKGQERLRKELHEKINALMSISWSDIQPEQVIIIKRKSLVDETIRRQPYFITEVTEERRIVKDGFMDPIHFIFPFSGTPLQHIGKYAQYSSMNPDGYFYPRGQYKGSDMVVGGCEGVYFDDALSIIGWELPTEEERNVLLEEIQVLLQRESLQERTVFFLQRIEKSLLQEEA